MDLKIKCFSSYSASAKRNHRSLPHFTLLAALSVVAAFGLPTHSQAASIAIQAWVHDPVLAGVALSPDGKHLSAVSPPSIDAVPQVAVWKADDLSQPPLRFDLKAKDGGRWKPQGAFWLNSESLYVSGVQTFDVNVGARTIKTFRAKAFVWDLGKGRLLEPFGGGGSSLDDLISSLTIIDRLPLDDTKVLVAAGTFEGATDIYEMDLKSYRLKRVFRGATGSSAFTDLSGEVRGRTKFEGDGETARIEFEVRKVGSNDWTPAGSFFARDRQGPQPLGFSKDPNVLYMSDNKDREVAAVREYRLDTGELSEPIFAHQKYDATGVLLGQTKKKFGELLGFRYYGADLATYWVDADRLALQRGLNEAFPGMTVSLGSFSDDESRAIIFVSSSNDPGSYYLYDAAKGLTALGRPRPLLDPAKLASTELVSYQARDGLTIPAFLTIPKTGSKPFPAVVMPHGGPWARDDIGFDTWRQFLADRGYVVLQPQYRGSDGWGQTLWRAGDREWGQKMQDDKDDGAQWLVDQGLVAKDRIAMYGFSYGGYAAMAAIVRPNPPYQCAIAGAGLSELRTFDKITFETRFGREFQNPTIAGLSPLDVVQQASIPIMIFHGDRDQIVPIEQSEKYYAALKKAGKNVQYIEIDDYGHGPSLSIAKQAQVLEILETYLARDCGPGGL